MPNFHCRPLHEVYINLTDLPVSSVFGVCVKVAQRARVALVAWRLFPINQPALPAKFRDRRTVEPDVQRYRPLRCQWRKHIHRRARTQP